MLGNLGNWWNGGAPGAAMGQPRAGGLDTYAARMRAAQANAPVQSPLVASYTPPAYQTTPPHVDINAVIAAMNGAKAAGQPQVAGQAPAMPGMMAEGGALGEQQGSDFGGMASGMELAGLNAEAERNSANGAAGLAKGGPVTAAHMAGPNPPGPDDGFVPLDKGEYVIKASAAKTIGKPALAKINAAAEDTEHAEIAREVTRRLARRDKKDDMKGKKG